MKRLHLKMRIFNAAVTIIATQIVLISNISISAQEPTTIEGVLRVWREREKATSSVWIETSGHYMTGKDSSMEGPPHDITSKEKRVVVIDGDKMRHERVFVGWDGTTSSNEPFTVISVFNGRQSKTVTQSQQNNDQLHPVGWIANSEGHPDKYNVHLSAIVKHFRPLSPLFGAIDASRLSLLSSAEEVGGKRCLVLEEAQSSGVTTRRYWVCPEQDMAIVRYVSLNHGKVAYQADISFNRGAVGFVPSSWSAIHFAGEVVVSSSTATVEKVQVNVPISLETFDVVFPSGTEVFDRATKKRFLIKPDGSRRDVLRVESSRKAKYTELLATDPGDAGTESQRRKGGWTVTATIVVVLIACLLAVSVRRVLPWQRY